MSVKAKTATLSLSVLLLVGIAGAGYWWLQESKPKVCEICERSIHPHSSAVVLIDKKPVRVCCIRCGITHNFQVGKAGEVVEVTDFISDKPIRPDGALYVEGSQISMCDPHNSSLIDQTKHPFNRIFDRCEPSTYAFARRGDAEAFVQQNGGKLLTWEELMKEVGVIR
jgi:hypothetical protein